MRALLITIAALELLSCKKEQDHAKVEFFANSAGCNVETSGSAIRTESASGQADYRRTVTVEVGSTIRIALTPTAFLGGLTRPAYVKIDGWVKDFEFASTPDTAHFVPAVIEMKVPALNRYGEEI